MYIERENKDINKKGKLIMPFIVVHTKKKFYITIDGEREQQVTEDGQIFDVSVGVHSVLFNELDAFHRNRVQTSFSVGGDGGAFADDYLFKMNDVSLTENFPENSVMDVYVKTDSNLRIIGTPSYKTVVDPTLHRALLTQYDSQLERQSEELKRKMEYKEKERKKRRKKNIIFGILLAVGLIGFIVQVYAMFNGNGSEFLFFLFCILSIVMLILLKKNNE